MVGKSARLVGSERLRIAEGYEISRRKDHEQGPRIVYEEAPYEPLGLSKRWEGRKRSEREERERRKVLEEWRGREDRGAREGRKGRVRNADQELGSGRRSLALRKEGSNGDQKGRNPSPASRKERNRVEEGPTGRMLCDLESSRAFTPTLAHRAQCSAQEVEEARDVREEE